MTRALAVALALGLLAAGAAGAAERHVVLISIDGLRPAFYLEDGWETPTLRALARAGAYARAAEPVFPTVTYPNHASIATGVRPAFHGIAFNTRFVPGERGAHWYADERDLRAAPIWEWARAKRLSTAAVSWPTTVGAAVDALVPEENYYAQKAPLEELRRASTPGLFERIGVTPTAAMFRSVARWDDFLTATAAAIIRHDRPRLLLLHLAEADFEQHRSGTGGDAVQAAVRHVDARVGEVMAALREAGIADQTAVIVTGDHGFAPITATVFPNRILTRAGLRACPGPGDWRATVHVTGAAGAVYVSPPADPDTMAVAESALRAAAAGRYTLISRLELDQMGAFPNAAVFAVEAAPGFGMSGACNRGPVEPARGATHGYLPSRPGMETGFIAAGDGVRAGVALDRVRLIDIAPTIARLLGLTPPRIEGHALDEVLR